MSKNLSIIQTVMKVLRIITKIVYIVCIVGAIISAISTGFAIAAYFGAKTFFDITIDGKTLEVIMLEETGMDIVTAIGYSAAGVVMSCASVITSKLACNYFDQEIEDGTPFTYAGADLLKKVAIRSFIISIVAVAIAAIAVAIITMGKETNIKIDGDISIFSPLAMWLVSVIFRYGAEVREQNSNKML